MSFVFFPRSEVVTEYGQLCAMLDNVHHRQHHHHRRHYTRGKGGRGKGETGKVESAHTIARNVNHEQSAVCPQADRK